MEQDQLDALQPFLRALERLGLRYAISGSLASSMHGKPRTTEDADVLVELPQRALPGLVAALREEFYVPESLAERAVEARSSFNVIHHATQRAIDIFVAGDGALDREQMERRLRVPIFEGGEPVGVTSPEVLVIRKLDWFRRGGEVSERQWRDVLGILLVQGDEIERALMVELAGLANVGDLLERALAEADAAR